MKVTFFIPHASLSQRLQTHPSATLRHVDAYLGVKGCTYDTRKVSDWKVPLRVVVVPGDVERSRVAPLSNVFSQGDPIWWE